MVCSGKDHGFSQRSLCFSLTPIQAPPTCIPLHSRESAYVIILSHPLSPSLPISLPPPPPLFPSLSLLLPLSPCLSLSLPLGRCLGRILMRSHRALEARGRERESERERGREGERETERERKRKQGKEGERERGREGAKVQREQHHPDCEARCTNHTSHQVMSPSGSHNASYQSMSRYQPPTTPE